MASVPTFAPNPYANFDPSQWSDPYSQFQSSALPWPSSYVGWPTNALGQPIQAPPGMTLNSQPAAAAPAPTPFSAGAPTFYAGRPGQPNYQTSQQWSPSQFLLGAPGVSQAQARQNQQAETNYLQGLGPSGTTGGGSGVSPLPAQAANPAGLTSQQYLSLLAHPGNVATPGATVPQASPGWQPSNGVLQQFLQNWRPAQSGPGSAFGQNFAAALGR